MQYKIFYIFIKRLLVILNLFIFPFASLKEYEEINYTAEFLEVSSTQIKILVNNSSLNIITFEVNGKNVESSDNKLVLDISLYQGKRVFINALSSKGQVSFELINSKNKSIVVEDSKYYLSYYLKSYSSNLTIINNKFNNYISIVDYQKENELYSINYFDNAILPSFNLFNYIKPNLMEVNLNIFVKEGTFMNLPYFQTYYSFPYQVIYQDMYSFKLKDNYSYTSNQEMYLGKDNPIDRVIFPTYFDEKIVSLVLQLKIAETEFIFPFSLYFVNGFKDYQITEIEVEKGTQYEKEIVII